MLGSDLGKAVVANAATQILLRQALQAIDEITRTFDLSDGRTPVPALRGSRTGSLVSTGTQRVAFQSIASPTEHYLVTSNPAELAEYSDDSSGIENSFVELGADDTARISPDSLDDERRIADRTRRRLTTAPSTFFESPEEDTHVFSHCPFRPLSAAEAFADPEPRLRPIGVWNWTLPAWAGRLPDGRTYNTCPQRGNLPRSVLRPQRQLSCSRPCKPSTRPIWRSCSMTWPAGRRRCSPNSPRPRFRGRLDPYPRLRRLLLRPYLAAWLRIIRAAPGAHVLLLHQGVSRFRAARRARPAGEFPVDLQLRRHTGRRTSTPTTTAWPTSSPTRQHHRGGLDLPGSMRHRRCSGRRLVGVPANRIPTFVARMAGRRFSEWQAEVDAERAARTSPSASAPGRQRRAHQFWRLRSSARAAYPHAA